ncbi:unnamed protein product [Cuscuta epithymum]|uniref:Endoglucanase n=1 Tax=Cuscuta epithymum TaxID=186058 RepID=A0AAV0G061_9ASTE|nr:unnamed protein product [Cuscuta epithymum]
MVLDLYINAFHIINLHVCIYIYMYIYKSMAGGLYYLGEWSNLQYLTASFLLGTYAKQLKSAQHPAMPICVHSANDLIEFVRQQVDYVLGDNPKGMSYMVGFGDNYPLKIHHRGASIVSVKKYPKSMGCYGPALTTNDANPNIHVGAITGGPDESDEYEDNRQNYQQSEPATYINAAFVGVVASLLAQ